MSKTFRDSCKSLEHTAIAVIPAQAGNQKVLFSKKTGFPITTSGMTNPDFFKSRIIKKISGYIMNFLRREL
jgi:hypothetical protein